MGQQNYFDFTLRRDVSSSNTSTQESLHDDDKAKIDTRRSSPVPMSPHAKKNIEHEHEFCSQAAGTRKQVSFSKIEIQEFTIQLGDNPATAGVQLR
jgi:hypothetical protein